MKEAFITLTKILHKVPATHGDNYEHSKNV